MARIRHERYLVTGPGIEVEPSYAHFGPALSRSVTAACASEEDGSWYVRDSISHEILGHSTRLAKMVTTVALVERDGTPIKARR